MTKVNIEIVGNYTNGRLEDYSIDYELDQPRTDGFVKHVPNMIQAAEYIKNYSQEKEIREPAYNITVGKGVFARKWYKGKKGDYTDYPDEKAQDQLITLLKEEKED
ncbi:MAG: hypothetical protein KKF46_05070 [Nanoarchaeota archaeon]|nr:hypothetical protein [Nanoarchaeota archaeon]MBU1321705.1 hypothetical protein [Nanoarchaeota archaeon]MBU1597285.1 hypothetical protein [Nanoarchaeota archaeon]MBU2442249.1 hypothetical protein [Nanoarchaeota archaeon]